MAFGYKHLDSISKPSGVFTHAIKYFCSKATKAMYCIRRGYISDCLNILHVLRMFEMCVKQILSLKLEQNPCRDLVVRTPAWLFGGREFQSRPG